MTYETIHYEVRDSVAWITLNRPAAFNALSLQSMKDLFHIANRLGSDKSVRAAVAHVFEISDGKIVRFDQYVDSATINAIISA